MARFELTTDEAGVRDYRRMRAAFNDAPGQNPGGGLPAGPGSAVPVELTEPIYPDNPTPIGTRQVRWDGEEWKPAKQVESRTSGGRPLLIKCGNQGFLVSTQIRLQIQLTEDLEPATDFATGSSTAMANVLFLNSDGDLEVLQHDGDDVEIEITQRYEHLETIVAHTYGAAIIQDNEWQLDGADCDAATGGLLE